MTTLEEKGVVILLSVKFATKSNLILMAAKKEFLVFSSFDIL